MAENISVRDKFCVCVFMEDWILDSQLWVLWSWYIVCRLETASFEKFFMAIKNTQSKKIQLEVNTNVTEI